MKKRFWILGFLSILILITGCIDSTTVISIGKDGSGTLTETVYLNQSVKAMMEGMMAQMGGEEDESKEEEKKSLDLEKYKTKAAKMGEGVHFVSAKEVTGKDGSPGTEVIYSFEDIRKLNFKVKPENPMGDQMAGMMEAEESEDDEDEDPIKFDFIKGSTPKLVIYMPKEEKPESPEDVVEEMEEEDPEADAAGMGMMKMFLEGFRIRVLINPLKAKIKKTNATFVESIDGKETVTLLDVKLGEIMGNEKYRDQWENLSKMKDMNSALEEMKNIPGLKIETQDRVEISLK